MNDIFCPHCKKAFKVDESGYADVIIVNEDDFLISDSEEAYLADKEKLDAVGQQEKPLTRCENPSPKRRCIQNLKAQIDGSEMKEKLAINGIKIEKERDGFRR